MQENFSDEAYNKNWRALLVEFKAVNPSETNAKEKYLALIEKASTINPLTYRQREGIIDRCKYQIHLIDNPEERKPDFKPNDYHRERMKK